MHERWVLMVEKVFIGRFRASQLTVRSRCWPGMPKAPQSSRRVWADLRELAMIWKVHLR